MKRRLYLILLFSAVTFSSMAQTIGEAFYIYRNDGQFNAFFRDEVDSITFSHYDLDSLYYDENVTQLIYTADSLYRIPLAAIDSVGFITPETVYKPGVKVLEGEILKYVLSQESLTIFFNISTPEDFLPHVGDKLVTMEMTDVFPIGFAGEVESVTTNAGNIEVICAPVSLLDVFECYYGVEKMEWDGSRIRRANLSGRHKAEIDHTFSPGSLTLNLLDDHDISNSYNPNDNLSFSLNELRADISVTPVIHGNAFWIINPWYVMEHGVYVKLSVYGEYDLEENFGIKGSVNWRKNKSIVRVPWPILPLADVYVEVGGFVEANGEMGISQKWTQKYKSQFLWEYSSRGENVLNPVNRLSPVSSNHSGEATVKGSIGAGLYLQLGLDFIHTKDLDIANVNLEGRAGVKLSGELVLSKTDMESAQTSTAIYEQLRDTQLSLDWFYGISANASVFKYGVSYDVPLDGLPFATHGTIARFALAPTFSDVKASYSSTEASEIDAEARLFVPASLGGCLPVDAGLVLKDEDGYDVSSGSYAVYDFRGGTESKTFYSQFYNVSSGKKYKVYPHIKWMGVDILASPYAEVEGETSCPDENHPHWIDLGLPSGTKWACCNVGASAPEQYGNYYAWGETQPKEVYNWATYKYGSSKNNVVNIGSDIAGTSYDAATANWGAPWRMPSKTQRDELLGNCSSVWTTQNGVNGRKFTGPNGGTIFLPAAGFRRNELLQAGSEGDYWSSTLNESNPGSAWDFGIFSNRVRANVYGYRNDGISVRPVR